MLGFFNKLISYKQSIIVVIVLVCTLIGFSLTYRYKLEKVMFDYAKQQMQLASTSELNNINKSITDIIKYLKIASRSLSENQIGSNKVYQPVADGLKNVVGFLDVGVADIYGKSIYGFQLPDGEIQKIIAGLRKGAYVGYVPDLDNSYYDIIIAVPVYTADYISNILFVRITETEWLRYLDNGNNRVISLNKSRFSFLSHDFDKIVHINDFTINKKIPYEVMVYVRNLLSQDGIDDEDNAERTANYYKNFLGRNANQLFLFQSDDLQKFYVTVLNTNYDGFYYLNVVSAAAFDSRINSILIMFVVFAICFILVVVILLIYYEFTVNASKKSIHNLAYVDEFTQLPNKSSLRLKFKEMSLASKPNNHNLYIVKLVISNYNWISRLYGFKVAEKFEMNVANYFRKLTDEHVFISRVQDFFVLLIATHGNEDIKDILTESFDKIDTVDTVDFKAVYTCGVAEYIEDEKTVINDELLDFYLDNCAIAIAASAKNKSKEYRGQFKNRIYFYSPKFREEIQANSVFENELQPALESKDFLVFLQPKYDLETNKLVGAEALVRWNYRGQGIIPPFKFIPIFEKNGSIAAIDNYVFDETLALLRKWKSNGMKLVPVSVNLSQVQFLNPNLVSELRKKVENDLDLIPYIDIEITESATVGDTVHVIDLLTQIKKIGFKLSMDDFGTGYSSLSNLSVMPFDTVKIDKSFVDRAKVTDPKSIIIIKDIALIAKHFNIHTLVEGVETLPQKNLLKSCKCEYCQGYYYSKPIPVADFEELLTKDEVFVDKVGEEE